jgi:HTH-type transcriptional regulator, sugar sensing transcriptional regulator
MQKELQQLGYSPNQISVYLALLELGQTTVGPIIKKTGLHRQVVYNTLEELERADLIQSTIKNNRQNFAIIDPHKIIDNIIKKQNLAEELLPELLSRQKKGSASQEIKIYEGVEGFQTMHYNNIKNTPANGEYLVIGAGGKRWTDIMQKNNFVLKYEKLRLEKNIQIRLLSYEDVHAEWDLIKDIYGQGEKNKKFVRFLAKEFNNPVGIQVYFDRVELISYVDPIIIVEIKNMSFVKTFKQYFETLWHQEVKNFRGFEELKNVFYNMIDNDLVRGEEYHVINANLTMDEQNKDLIEFFKKYHSDRQKKGIYAKLLFSESSKPFIEKNKANYSSAQLRFMPAGISNPMQINIYKNKTVMILMEKEPVIFVIDNEKITQSYEQYFQTFWDISRE